MPLPRISVVCPFFNEEAILESAAAGMLANLTPFGNSVELVMVNDGSTDGSKALAEQLAASNPRVRLISYNLNQGRGHALKTGIDNARGEIIVTTEIDLSWGDDIVSRLVQAMDARPKAALIIASPNLPQGGYRNVPAKRVLLSRVGNTLLRLCISRRITMYTGMTRCYRAAAIQGLPTCERGKEFHLEVAMKALALGWEIEEIPCVLEWKDHKLVKNPSAPKRKSSTNIPRIIRSHLLFSFLANPSQYLILAGIPTLLLAGLFLLAGVVRFFHSEVAIYLLLTSGILCLIGMNLLIFAMLARQNSSILGECWRLQCQVKALQDQTRPSATTQPTADPAHDR